MEEVSLRDRNHQPGMAITGDLPMKMMRGGGHVPLGTGASSDDEDLLLYPLGGYQRKPTGVWTWLTRAAVIALCASFAAVAISFGLCGFWMGVRVNLSDTLKKLHARPLKKLDQSTVILISFDGFRWDYPFKAATPNIDRLKAEGTEAEGGIIPIFPTITEPNHYTLVTGLYAESHGIIANNFRDPESGETFNFSVTDPKWWMAAEPIYVTAQKRNIPAATIYWPGSNIKRDGWDCEEQFCKRFQDDPEIAIPGIDTILSYFDGDPHGRPRLIAFYFNQPDHIGHQNGPDDPQTDVMIGRVDGILGRLLQGLEERGILDDINVIVLADHGMIGTCAEKTIFLEDISPIIKTHGSKIIDSVSPFLLLHPPAGVDAQGLTQDMVHALHVLGENDFLKLYYKDDIPDSLHYRNNRLIAPIVGVAADGYSMRIFHSDKQLSGQHGYLPTLGTMHPLFVARGPRFGEGRKVPSFSNTELYGLICDILGIAPLPNNGTPGFADTILLPVQQ